MRRVDPAESELDNSVFTHGELRELGIEVGVRG